MRSRTSNYMFMRRCWRRRRVIVTDDQRRTHDILYTLHTYAFTPTKQSALENDAATSVVQPHVLSPSNIIALLLRQLLLLLLLSLLHHPEH